MNAITKMKITDVATFYNTEYLLRPVDETLAGEYAEKMIEGIKFPPLTVGTFKDGDKAVRMMPDGAHRFWAISAINNNKGVKLKFETVDVIEKEYKTKSDALLDQLVLNQQHGYRVDVGDRDERIRTLIGMKQLTVRAIAEKVGLSHASVVRIGQGKQKAGQAGRKRGKKSSKEVKPIQPKRFMRNVEEILTTIRNARSRAEVIAYLWPESKKGEKQDARIADVKTCLRCSELMATMAKELEKEAERPK